MCTVFCCGPPRASGSPMPATHFDVRAKTSRRLMAWIYSSRSRETFACTLQQFV